MKSQKAIVGILAAILVVNIIGVIFVSTESKKQTEIALQTAELEAIQAQLIAYEMEMTYSDENGYKYFIGHEAINKIECINTVRDNLNLPTWYQVPVKSPYENNVFGYATEYYDYLDTLADSGN